jgi:hypothetical protein
MITVEVAPYVRAIIAYDYHLMQDRVRRSGLLGEGGRPGKRMRNTRSALSAMEGGSRSTTRRENYFAADVNTHLVLRTAGDGWEAAVAEDIKSSIQDCAPDRIENGSSLDNKALLPVSSMEAE